MAEGVTWTSRTSSAPWAARRGHTSVIDAAGAIYVIGGYGNSYSTDLWVSTDRGADPDSAVLGGFSRGSRGVLGGIEGYSQVLRCIKGY